MTMEPGREPRGVSNPRVVDLVSFDGTRDEVTLLMLELRPWDSEGGQLRQLEAKFNAYLEYVLGGHIGVDYPQYQGKDVCFQLDCAAPPRGDAEGMLRAMQSFAEAEGSRFVVRVIQAET